MDTLQSKLGYTFKNKESLIRALTHRSCGGPNNERLEFLGDSVLNFVAADMLFDRFQTLKEGDMSRVRAGLVREEALAKIAKKIGLDKHLRYIDTGKHPVLSATSLADALEAIFGAIYKEAGLGGVKPVIEKLLMEMLSSGEANLKKDFKTQLQEYLQGLGHPLPEYGVVKVNESGPEDTRFTVSCTLRTLHIVTTGKGRIRKAAEIDAAKSALSAARQRR